MTETAFNTTTFPDFLEEQPETMNAIPKDFQLPLVVVVRLELFDDFVTNILNAFLLTFRHFLVPRSAWSAS
jgi:hypothetical protein